MKKNNKITIFTIFAIIITMIALIITSGTYAKYTSSIDTESSSATVAKWSIKVNNQDITKTQESITFDIFDTIYDSDGIAIEDDVAETKIAPGTTGSFNFKIENASEVSIKYSIAFTETNDSSIPIEYSLDQNTYYNAAGLTNALNESEEEIGIGASKTVNVYWRWAYEGNGSNSYSQTDATDKALGIAAQNTATTPTYEVKATIIATQAD